MPAIDEPGIMDGTEKVPVVRLIVQLWLGTCLHSRQQAAGYLGLAAVVKLRAMTVWKVPEKAQAFRVITFVV